MKGFDKKYIRIGLLLVICACLCISFYFLMKNGAESLIAVKDHAVNTMLPFINGLVLAYLLNPIMKAIEERLMLPLFEKNEKLKNKKTLARGLSLLLTIIIFALILTGLIVMIVPQLFSSIQSIILRTPSYLASLNRLVSDMLKNNPDFEELFNTYSGRLETLINNEVLPALQSLISTVSSTLLSYVYGFVQSIIKFIVGIILCVYLLFRKEAYLAQCKKVVYAFMSSPERANQLINNARFTNRTFGGFITGKLFDSLIIGIITFIALSIMRMPYTLLISCIIGVTNIIPFFGPFLGAIPSAFIILLISPMKCLVFIIYVIILQQFDGNILGPKILGDSTGLPSFWVIFAITLFGGIFGIVGMFIGVPIFSVIYAAFRANLESRLKRKKMPSDTEFYINSDYYPAEISVTDKLTSLSGEHLILKDGTVSERIQDNRSRVKTRPRKEKNNGSASKQTPES